MKEYFECAEGSTQERERSDPSRFIDNIAAESLKHGNNGDYNKLGMDWFDKYGWPTLTKILLGLKEEERKQLTLTSGLHPSSEEFHDALQGLQEAWESYFEELGPIVKGKLAFSG